MSSVQRIIAFIEFKGMNKSEFYKKSKLSNGYLDKVKELGADKIESIISEFPDLSVEWLITGKGEMLKDNQNLTLNESEEGYSIKQAPKGRLNKRAKPGELIKFYDADFAASRDIEFFDDETSIKPAYMMDIPEFAGCIAFRTYSDSMEPLIKGGDILFATKVEDWRDGLEYGQIYGITRTDRRRHLKYIRRSPKHQSHFLLKSENSEMYDDFELDKEKIKNVWLIHGWINKRT